MPTCQPFLDDHQYAYRAREGVEDVIILYFTAIFSNILRHKSYVTTLFLDLSSAFNTIQPHLLVPKFLEMGGNKNTC